MPSKKKRLTQAERRTYFNAARELSQAGVEIKVLEELLVSARAIDVYLASPVGLGSRFRRGRAVRVRACACGRS